MKYNKLRIAYAPFENEANEYTENMKNLLSEYGTLEKVPSFREVIKKKLFRCFDLIIINWTDNDFINKHGGINYWIVAKESLRLLAFRVAARKIIFVRHNVFPHKTNPASRGTAKFVVDFYERLFHISWVHSGHLDSVTRHYIPHPLYDPQCIDEPTLDGLMLPENYFVVFGRILPYKKIEELIAVLPSDINLVIAGAAPDKDYLNKLLLHVAGNIIFIPQFISDSLAKNLIGMALGTVVCNADEDMIVSGSMIFSISVGVPVIALETPFGVWFNHCVNPNMIITACGMKELVEKMRTYSNRADKEDILAAKAHFSPQTVRQKIRNSLRILGLI